jgi:replicative DNA helicase
LKDKFEVIGYSKPNCNVKSQIVSVQVDIASLSNNDVLFFLGGTNDICYNNIGRSLRHICQFVKRNAHMNVIIASTPDHYDLAASSKVNQEVQKFNRKLKKYMKLDTHVTVLDIEPDSSYFTNHGLHLNDKG